MSNNCCQPFNPLASTTNCCDSSFSDSTPYFESVEALRQYIIDREANRKLEDLVNVEDGIGTYSEGTILGFDTTTQKWTIVSGFNPIIF